MAAVNPVMLLQTHLPISFLLWCIPLFCVAQADNPSIPLKHEVGISLLSISSKYGHELTPDFYVNIFNGIRYKRHLGIHAIRLGAEFKDSHSGGVGDVIGECQHLEGKFNLGYQLTFVDKSIRPYIAVDCIYLVSTFTSSFYGGYAGTYSAFDLLNQGIGFAPAFGIYFRLVKSLSISWESNLEFLWVTEHGTITRSDPHHFQSRTTYPYHRRVYNSFLNPVKSISMNYGF